MLPVQTVMIRYMVLVYRWGSGRLGAVGACGGSFGSSTTGGGARGGALSAGVQGHAKAPPTRDRRGLKEILIFKSLVSIGMNAKG